MTEVSPTSVLSFWNDNGVNLMEENENLHFFKTKKLNEEIVKAHNAHIKNGNNELIDVNMQPNENIVYHLYSNGIITHQKGSYAYLQRSEHEITSYLIYKYRVGQIINGNLKYVPAYISYMQENYNKDIQYFDPIFTFPLETESYGGITYAILTKEECEFYREKMGDIIKTMKTKLV